MRDKDDIDEINDLRDSLTQLKTQAAAFKRERDELATAATVLDDALEFEKVTASNYPSVDEALRHLRNALAKVTP